MSIAKPHNPYTPAESAAVRQPLEKASLLPPHAYSDEKIYHSEVDVMRRSWIAAAHVSEIPDNGSYLARELLGEPLLLSRDHGGKVRVMSNVCRHRNSLLVKGSGRCGPEDKLRCPYHHWTYRIDGQLESAPFMQKTEGYQVSDIRLPEIRFEIWQGFIFVNVDGTAASLTPQLAELDAVLSDYHIDQLQCVDFTRYPVNWSWKVTMENFSEAYHQIAIHPQTIEPYFPARHADYEGNGGAPFSLMRLTGAQPADPNGPFPVISTLTEKGRQEVVVINVYPLFHVLIEPSGVYWLDWNLRKLDDHDIIWKLLVPAATKSLPDFEKRKELVYDFLKEVWAEDIGACTGVQHGVGAYHARAGRMSYMERAVHQFHNWLLDQYA